MQDAQALHKGVQSLLMAAEGSYGQVLAPSVYGVDGVWMNVMKDKPATAVWVEAKEEVVQYLIDAVAAERDSGKHHRVAPRLLIEPSERIDDTGVCLSSSTGHVRARKKDDDGKTVSKFIKLEERRNQIGTLTSWIKKPTACKIEDDANLPIMQTEDELEEAGCKEEM